MDHYKRHNEIVAGQYLMVIDIPPIGLDNPVSLLPSDRRRLFECEQVNVCATGSGNWPD